MASESSSSELPQPSTSAEVKENLMTAFKLKVIQYAEKCNNREERLVESLVSGKVG